MIDPFARHQRRTDKSAGDPEPPSMFFESFNVKPIEGVRSAPLSMIDSIGMYQSPAYLMLPLNEVSDGKDASLNGIGRVFSTSVSIKPMSQFDRQIFVPEDAFGRYGADIKLATYR